MGCGGFPADDERGTVRKEVLIDYAKKLPSINLEERVHCSNPICQEPIENKMPAIKTFYGYFHTGTCYDDVKRDILPHLPKLDYSNEVNRVNIIRVEYKGAIARLFNSIFE